ncbi:hypothetical protein [Amycolatopsis nigrescens]|uniref:hypothetical protein n=1 Tax=Amycolatopsis nigrescens TaxID=381445 RepID=UPI00037594D6|nr:hypothetical protein [Amycolatopsis nigrescens]
MTTQTPDDSLAVRIADGVLAHPSVVRLDAGALGVVATHLPGRRVLGVRAGESGEPVDISVVLTLGGRLPEVTGELRKIVREIAGDVPVNVTVTDVAEPSAETAAEQSGTGVR